MGSCWTPWQPCQAIHSLQGPQVRDCPWSSRVQGLQEVNGLLHACALCSPCNSVHSRQPPFGFKDSSLMLYKWQTGLSPSSVRFSKRLEFEPPLAIYLDITIQ